MRTSCTSIYDEWSALLHASIYECTRCGHSISVPFPRRGTRSIGDFADRFVDEFDVYHPGDDNPQLRCPNCSELHTFDEYLTAIPIRGGAQPFACLLWYCENCQTRVAAEHDRCRVCETYGDDGHTRLAEDGMSCALCNLDFLPRDLQDHHVSYVPEETISVCTSCHRQIHREGHHDELTPDVSRDEWKTRKSGGSAE